MTGKGIARVGIGYDIHRLVEGRKLILGGVEFDFPRGLLGHSDADVLLHAICDALLGAAGEGDIGRHFPDTDPHYRGIASRKLLAAVGERLKSKGWAVVNIDATVVLEAPRLASRIEEMQEKIAATLEIPRETVNVKAGTNEGLDAVGRGEAIAAFAIAAVVPIKTHTIR